jgi:hypothetical protein
LIFSIVFGYLFILRDEQKPCSLQYGFGMDQCELALCERDGGYKLTSTTKAQANAVVHERWAANQPDETNIYWLINVFNIRGQLIRVDWDSTKGLLINLLY